MLHSQQHPGWSTKDNYGKKRMRIRGDPCSTASAPKPAQEPEQVKWPSVNVPAYGTFHSPQVNHVPPTAHTNPSASTSYSPYVYPCIGPAAPVDSPPSTVAPTEPMATFVGDTVEDLLSAFDHLDAFLLAPLPQEPIFPHSDPCLGPATPVDSPTSTLPASPVSTIKPMSAFFCDPEEDLLALLKQLSPCAFATEPQQSTVHTTGDFIEFTI
ncbi:transcription factor 7-like 1-B [Archocentrus centrarchus]|uniref:transcription factor 7-like 1-B n=1 Tax=Archocentrus centrarchus TaxID=63155 RepID=UPI0011E9E897|nr:transcription factor 7-like 1-B [Archocentrus centrarchus]